MDPVKKYVELDSIEDALETGDTVLIKGTFLLDLCARKGNLTRFDGILPRRQDLPKEAFWEPSEIMKLARKQKAEFQLGLGRTIVALSFCWLTPEHPDPKGEQLATLCKVIRLCLKRFREQGIPDIAIFLDWCSLFQSQ